MKRFDIKTVNKLLVDAIETKNQEKAWEVWLTKLPNMDSKSFVSFKEFYRRIQKPEINKKQPVKDIVSMAEKIKKADQKHDTPREG